MAVAAAVQTFFVSGGTVPLEAPSYVERAADRQILDTLRGGKFCYVLNSRQMGKSSLCVRTKARLESEGARVAFVDLTKIGGRNVTPEQWYAGLLVEIGRALDLRTEMMGYWKENAHLSPMQRLFGSLREVVLEQVSGSVAIFIDEIDSTRSLPFDTDEFFAGIRECYNRRVHDPAFERLSFCLLGVAVPSDLIRDARTTPFNIGDRVYLRDFTLEEAQAFAVGLPGRERLIRRVHHWTGGHPFLTQSVCAALAKDTSIQSDADVDAFIAREFLSPKARETHVNLADVGNRVLNGYADGDDIARYRADILSAYEKALRGKEELQDDESNRITAVLKLSGLMRSQGKALRPRNHIYERVFGREWIRENMPGQELRRQRRAFWLGAIRTATITGIIIAFIGWLAWNNSVLKARAEAERDRANYEVYVSSMALLPTLWERGDLSRMDEVLKRTGSSPSKGWEWNYWHGKAHSADRELNQQGGFGHSLSPDGKHLMVRMGDESRLIDAQTFHTVKTYAADSTARFSPVVLPDGETFVDGDSTGRMIRRIKDGGIVGRFPNGIAVSPKLESFSSDGSFAIGYEPNTITPNLLDLKTFTAKPISDEFGSTVYALYEPKDFVLFAEDYRTDAGQPGLSLRELYTWKELWREPLVARAFDVSLSPDGSRCYVGLANGRVNAYETSSGKQLWSFPAFEQEVLRARLSRDGKTMVVSSRERFAKVYRVSDKGLDLIASYPDAVNVAISPDGSRVYLGYWWLRAHDVRPNTGEARFVPKGNYRGIRLFKGSIVGLASASQGEAWLIDPFSGKTTKLKEPGAVLGAGLYNPVIFALAKNGSIEVLKEPDGTKIGSINLKLPDQFPLMDFPNSGKAVVLGKHNDYQIRDWSDDTTVAEDKFDQPITTAAVSWDEKWLVMGLVDGTVHIRNLLTDEKVEIRPHSARILKMTVARDNMSVISSADDDTAVVFRLSDGKVLARLLGHSQSLGDADISPDGTRYVTGSDDRTVRIWDAATARELTVLEGHKAPVRAIGFTDDGQSIVSVDTWGDIRVWSQRTAKEKQQR